MSIVAKTTQAPSAIQKNVPYLSNAGISDADKLAYVERLIMLAVQNVGGEQNGSEQISENQNRGEYADRAMQLLKKGLYEEATSLPKRNSSPILDQVKEIAAEGKSDKSAIAIILLNEVEPALASPYLHRLREYLKETLAAECKDSLLQQNANLYFRAMNVIISLDPGEFHSRTEARAELQALRLSSLQFAFLGVLDPKIVRNFYCAAGLPPLNSTEETIYFERIFGDKTEDEDIRLIKEVLASEFPKSENHEAWTRRLVEASLEVSRETESLETYPHTLMKAGVAALGGNRIPISAAELNSIIYDLVNSNELGEHGRRVLQYGDCSELPTNRIRDIARRFEHMTEKALADCNFRDQWEEWVAAISLLQTGLGRQREVLALSSDKLLLQFQDSNWILGEMEARSFFSILGHAIRTNPPSKIALERFCKDLLASAEPVNREPKFREWAAQNNWAALMIFDLLDPESREIARTSVNEWCSSHDMTHDYAQPIAILKKILDARSTLA